MVVYAVQACRRSNVGVVTGGFAWSCSGSIGEILLLACLVAWVSVGMKPVFGRCASWFFETNYYIVNSNWMQCRLIKGSLVSPYLYDFDGAGEDKSRMRRATFEALEELRPERSVDLPHVGFGEAEDALMDKLRLLNGRIDDLEVLAEAVFSLMDGVHEAVARSDSTFADPGLIH